MVLECLKHITTNDNISIDIKKSIIKYIDTLDEQQIIYILSNEGININNIVFKYYPNIGFRCFNINENVVGKLPICNYIQKKLNEKLLLLS